MELATIRVASATPTATPEDHDEPIETDALSCTTSPLSSEHSTEYSPEFSPPKELPVAPSTSTPLFVYVCALLACMSSLNTGYDIGIIATAILYMERDMALSHTQIQLLIASANFCAIIGAVTGGSAAHRFGRKRIIIASAIISCVAVLITAFAPSFEVVLFSRMLNGTAMGFSILVTPLYIAEMAPSSIRGKIVSMSEAFTNIGHILGYSMALALHYYGVEDSLSWRIMVGSGALISAMLLVSMMSMPESPRWLNLHGRCDEALRVLNKTLGSPSLATQLLEEMDASNKALEVAATTVGGSSGGSGWRHILFPCWFQPDLALRGALIVAAPVAMFAQLCGIQVFVLYTPKILENNGLRDENLLLATIAIGVAKTGCVLLAQSMMDRVGRRPLLIFSALSMAICVGLLGVVVQFSDSLVNSGAWIIAMLVLIVGCFSMGYGPVTWLLNSEIFALNVRAKGMAFCTVLNRLCAAMISLTFLSLQLAMSQHGAYYLYAVLGLFFAFFIYRKVPETKGRTLEEITTMLMAAAAGNVGTTEVRNGAPMA